MNQSIHTVEQHVDTNCNGDYADKLVINPATDTVCVHSDMSRGKKKKFLHNQRVFGGYEDIESIIISMSMSGV